MISSPGMQSKVFTVSDGELVLRLERSSIQDGGGFGVTSPMEPALVTEADTLEEAFVMARDALEALWEARVRRLKDEGLTSLAESSGAA